MSTLATELGEPRAQSLVVTEDSVIVDLLDGRTISVPLAWYPRLLHQTPEERKHWRLIGNGEGVHWPGLDEDLSVGSLLLGKLSGESQASLKRWLEARERRGKPAGAFPKIAAAPDTGSKLRKRRPKPVRRLEKKPDQSHPEPARLSRGRRTQNVS